MKVRVLVLYGFGINCDYETRHGFEIAGAQAERVHFNELIAGQKHLEDYQIMAIPGGFSFGDDIGAGKVLAVKFQCHLQEPLQRFIQEGNLVIGICNGFQVLVKLGLLPGINGDYKTQLTTLSFNDSGRFEDRWVYLKTMDSHCVFTRGIERLYLPVRHGEGKFMVKDAAVKNALHKNKQIVLKYVDREGKGGPGYPWNPNGSPDDIAGICDETGRIFGIMPHPEGYLYGLNHPAWTRESLPEEGLGLQVFRNGINYFKE